MKAHGDPLLAASMNPATRGLHEATQTEIHRESHASVGDPLLKAVEMHDSQQGEHRGTARLPLAPRNWAKELAGHGDPLLTVVVTSWATDNDDGTTMETNENGDTAVMAHGAFRKYHGDNLLKATMNS